MRRSHEPLLWLLFGAGGLLAAWLGPALILFTGILVPIAAERGVTLLGYEAARGLLQGPAGLAAVAVVTLLLFHAAHRIHHTLHDLGLPAGRRTRLGCYGAAVAGGALAAAAVLAL